MAQLTCDIVALVAIIVIFTHAPAPSVATLEDEAATLLNLKKSLSDDAAINNWNASVSPCNWNRTSQWIGVLCSNNGTTVKGLKLEGMGLGGLVDVDSLVSLPNLRSVSFMNNSFDGPLPDVRKLSKLQVVYLSDNKYSGEIPDDAFEGMNSLRKVNLARNEFSGNIPGSLAGLPKLIELDLEDNQFSGKIPNFAQRDWNFFSVADNLLEGPVPDSLSGEDPKYLKGNKDLCGKPMTSCKSSSKKKMVIILIVVVVAAVVASVIVAVFCFLRRAKPATTQQNLGTQTTLRIHQAQAPQTYTYKNNEQHGKLLFVRNDRERFELQELLRASAEILGSGSFGSSYKAALLEGPAMVVKRFRQMSNVGRDEFHEYMKRLGNFSHPNLLPLVAFYYRKEEKLLVFDFVENGSLASHLHGKRSPEQPALDWPTRLRIVKGVARGLAYLYAELPNLALPHGHLKSSNVLLDHTMEPLLTDYALMPVVNKEHAQECMVAYKSPESGRSTRKTDVWSLGILILETLTGKFSANYLKQGKADLAAWVNSVVREEWTGEVFDKEMKGTRNGEGEMLKLLKIGMCCCECNTEGRWDLKEAVEKIEELKERDADADDFSNSFASGGDVYSSRAITDDDFSFSVHS